MIKINWDVVFERLQFSLVEELKRRCPVHDADLRKSINAITSNEKLMIGALYYAPFVDEGTRPHMPPVDALEKWARDKLGDADLKWALAYHIKKYGTKPSWFIRDTIEQEFTGMLVEALRQPGAIEINSSE